MVVKVFPIISGYGAKSICSNVFICERTPADIIKNDLGSFPLNLGRYKIDMQEQSVTGTVLGVAKRKAVFRQGLGATLVNNAEELDLLPPVNILPPVALENNNSLDGLDGNPASRALNNLDQKQLQAALEEAFKDQEGKRGTRAVVVVHNGEIVAERYATGFTEKSKLAGWSLAKSVTAALIGILVNQSKLDIDQPAPVEEWKEDERSSITIANLLHMSSGLQWWEYYAAPSDATNMLYKERNMGEFALRKKLKDKPGKRFNYSSGSTNILSRIIRQTVGKEDYYQFPYKELLHKIGMNDTVLEVDAGGTFVGSSYCFGTARDWARFGLLFLHDGLHTQERVLPENWVKFTRTATTAKSKKKQDIYGAHWWLNTTEHSHYKNLTLIPDDCFTAKGYEGQYIWVIPSKNLVIVRLALEKGNKLDPNVFLPALIKAFRSS